jgi:amidase
MFQSLILAAALAASPYPVEEKSISDLKADLAAGRTSSVAVVQAYLDRIASLDVGGPALHSVIALNPHVLADAKAADAARAAGKPLGPLAGIPVLIKDNIESADGTATTAGSLALQDNVTGRDAPVVKRLTDAGALILGKTNLSEWANIRSNASISGWSAVGGLVKNPYSLDRNSCGSSSGTGAAIAASLAAVGVGTETDGSVTCPASINGLVGLKPTVGLVSRTYVVPISHSQDTPGPMARSVADAAILLTAMAGSDPADPATAQADRHRTDYLAALDGATLKGKRLGVLRYASNISAPIDALFEAALARMRAGGAEIVEIKDYRPEAAMDEAEFLILLTELKADLNLYLASTPKAVKTRTLADVIEFNAATPRETVLFGQELFLQAQETKGPTDPAYLKAKATAKTLAADKGIDALLAQYKVDALVAESYGPAWRTDGVVGDHASGPISGLAAVAGYPHLTVPMGQVRGLPVGLSLVGPAWSEARLLALGAAFEAVSKARKPPLYWPSVEATPDMAAAFSPMP